MSRRAWTLVGALAAAFPAAAEPTVSPLDLGFKVREFRGPGSYLAQIAPSADPALRQPGRAGPLVLVWGDEGAAALTLANGEVAIVRLKGSPANLGERPTDAIPDARQQSAGPLKAYFAAPRTDYAHGVLGDAVEAGTLIVQERQPVPPGGGVQRVPVATSRVEAGPDAVFEDLEPRLADLDGDGTPEIVVVKSYKDRGAALAVVAKRAGQWRVAAETPPIGSPNRWLNPAPIADLDRNGRPEIVVVRTPHIAGLLQVWAYEGGALAMRAEREGYSNHALGSPALDLAAAADIDGDGSPEIVVPTLDRRAVAIVSGRNLAERARIPLPARAEGGLAVLGQGAGARILVALEDGRVVLVKP